METNNSKINPIMITGILLEAVFLIFIIISFINLGKQDNRFGESININNFNTVKNLNSETAEKVTNMLYKTIARNNPSLTSVPNSNAIVRQDSITENNDGATYSGSFLVDIEEIKQSYKIQYSWSKNNSTVSSYDVVVSCPTKNELIYGDFDCTDIVTEENAGIISYLPYSVQDDNKNVIYYARVNAKNITIIDAVANTCNRTTATEYHNKLKQYFATIPEDYLKQYQINYSINCYTE